MLRRSMSFKVIEVDTNRKPVCDFLLMINSNRHPISYRFGVIAAYEQRAIIILGLLESAVDFLLVLIEHFSLGVTAEALRANIGSKSAISLQRLPVDQKFHVEAVAPLPTAMHLLRKLG